VKSKGITEHQLINNYKGKGKADPMLLTEHHAMKVYWGVEV
jgi:hypothetical protein